jgi:hypothetical protein
MYIKIIYKHKKLFIFILFGHLLYIQKKGAVEKGQEIQEVLTDAFKVKLSDETGAKYSS